MKADELAEIWLQGITHGDWAPFIAHLHPDYTESYPQTGEEFRGRESWVAMMEAWPEFPRGEMLEVRAPRDRAVQVVPSPVPLGQPLVHISDSDGRWTAEARLRYPDGSEYFLVYLGEVRDGLMYSGTLYWGAPDHPPEWRKPFSDTAS